jgi:hypothetical protein
MKWALQGLRGQLAFSSQISASTHLCPVWESDDGRFQIQASRFYDGFYPSGQRRWRTEYLVFDGDKAVQASPFGTAFATRREAMDCAERMTQDRARRTKR